MTTGNPTPVQISGLRALWQEAFGDTEDFLDIFFQTGFSPARCRCISHGDEIAAALYWFDCTMGTQKHAYVYAVATAGKHRGRGLCHRLMADTHALLKNAGYAGVILVPQQESLRQFYAGMGYRDMGGISEFSCAAGNPIPLRAIGREEFALRRRLLLPEMGVIQEGENLLFLAAQVQFYTGDNFLLSAWEEKGILCGVEFLGDASAAPGILAALGCREGRFRTPGDGPFAMFLPLIPEAVTPAYFGFAFD